MSAYPGKRLLDLLVLLATAPVSIPALALTALTVRTLDGSPVLFRQERAGLHGQPFQILKFRTMNESTNVDLTGLTASARITKSDAARITPAGRVLRKLSLDELPQLINVFRGDMSVVGPRPLFVRYSPYYSDRERLRLTVRPGITGLSQVARRNNGGWRERLELDARYVETASVGLDLKIMALTVIKAIRSEGVSVVAGTTGDALDDERSYPTEDGVSLRRIYARDLPTRVDWLTNPAVYRHMSVDPNITLESTENWHRAITADPNRRDYVFEDEAGQVVAMSGLKARGATGLAEFYVFVDPERHGRGVGSIATRLTLIEAAREGRFNRVWLSVEKQNAKAVKLYHRMHFEVTDESDKRYSMEVDLDLYRDSVVG